jgi:hypothetical protein
VLAFTFLLYRLLNEDTVVLSSLEAFSWLCMFASSGFVGLTLANWRGDWKTRLLLKLLAEKVQKA